MTEEQFAVAMRLIDGRLEMLMFTISDLTAAAAALTASAQAAVGAINTLVAAGTTGLSAADQAALDAAVTNVQAATAALNGAVTSVPAPAA